MKTDLPQSFRRLEYRAPNYTFSQVELDIALDPARTIVKSRLEVLPGAGHEAGAPLVLQGHELEFVSLRINGEAHRQFELTPEALTIHALPHEGKQTFIVEIICVCVPEKNTSLMGLYVSNGNFFTQCEAEGFRKSDYLYAEEKRVVEEHLKERYEKARSAGSKVQVAIIRPAAITGPRGRYMRIRFGLQAALSGQLKESPLHKLISLMVSFVPVTKKWCRQFIHEDDIANIVEILTFKDLKSDYDVFNACPPGEIVTGKDMAKAVGKKAIPVHPWLIRFAFFIMWNLTRGRVPTSKGGWKAYSYPIAVDGSKFSRTYSYTYFMSSKDAFVKKDGRYSKYVK